MQDNYVTNCEKPSTVRFYADELSFKNNAVTTVYIITWPTGIQRKLYEEFIKILTLYIECAVNCS